MSPIHHTLDYVELGATDLPATKAFYEQAFGWQFTDYGPEYAGVRAPDGTGEVGGLSAMTQPSTGGPLVLLYSEDVDASVAAVTTAGGRVLQEPYVFPGGRRFHFADPSGNELGVWGPA
ncbi:VOC family protein [Aeromicrobium sp. CF4.19]|uniref:VOC family protein n=1 Tax=Aeromicrobium sp. CF4.19 TaxID=3373082 RepID=UPI003EE43168